MTGRIAFIHVPKTGGGSIKYWLDKHRPDVIHSDRFNEAHLNKSELESIVGKIDWSFCCVRNTYARMISFYEFSKEKYGNIILSYEDYTEEQLNDVPEPEMQALEKSKKIYSVIQKGIIPFMQWSIETQHRASLSQLEWIKDVDYFCRIEHMKEDFKHVQEKLDCDLSLGKTHRVLSYNPKIYYNKQYRVCQGCR